jgi:glutamate formiminotransferase/formiminotetrahydrofolate cyclodeaminase
MLNNKLIECIPNFSEGRDKNIIHKIVNAISNIEGILVLNVDSGVTVNRTVVTFIGNPEAVVEAAYQGIKTAARLIDMSTQNGVHPRIGATDVCPLVPLKGISLDETVALARSLAKRVGAELDIPVYCYGEAAFKHYCKNLEACRKGGMEGVKNRFDDPFWKPDFGPCFFNKKAGVTVIGVRNLLIAYNISLNTSSIQIAQEIAKEIRNERSAFNNKMENLKAVDETFGYVKAIGWFIEEFDKAQVSMNIVDIQKANLYRIYSKVKEKAKYKGVEITGSEIIGLIPLQALIDAGKQAMGVDDMENSKNMAEENYISTAIAALGLNDLYDFKPENKILEYVIKEKTVI